MFEKRSSTGQVEYRLTGVRALPSHSRTDRTFLPDKAVVHLVDGVTARVVISGPYVGPDGRPQPVDGVCHFEAKEIALEAPWWVKNMIKDAEGES